MIQDITTYECGTRFEHARTLRTLWEKQDLWEKRADRKPSYRNGDWYTLGTALYLDLLSPEGFAAYKEKCYYFNRIMSLYFSDILLALRLAVSIALEVAPDQVQYLAWHFEPAAFPGFHIFPGHDSAEFFFGKLHIDGQGRVLEKMPGFTEKFTIGDMRSYTLPLQLPYLGGGMIGEVPIGYEEGKLYIHSGQFLHAIKEFEHPVLPNDMRISLQAHSFTHDGIVYLYW